MRLPDLGVEFEDPLERGAHLVESRRIGRQRRTAGSLELGLEIRPLEPEPEAMRLRDRLAIAVCRGKDPLELARCIVGEPRSDEDPREVDPCRRPAARGRAFEMGAGRGLVALLKREDPEELLGSPELLAGCRDPS